MGTGQITDELANWLSAQHVLFYSPKVSSTASGHYELATNAAARRSRPLASSTSAGVPPPRPPPFRRPGAALGIEVWSVDAHHALMQFPALSGPMIRGTALAENGE